MLARLCPPHPNLITLPAPAVSHPSLYSSALDPASIENSSRVQTYFKPRANEEHERTMRLRGVEQVGRGPSPLD